MPGCRENQEDAKEFQAACPFSSPRRRFNAMTDAANETAVARDARFASEALTWLPEVTRFARVLAGSDADGDDLAQETFLRAYRFWSSYMPGTDCRRWLITICRNVYRTRVVRENVVQGVGDDADLETIAAVRAHNVARGEGIDRMFEQMELGSAIRDAIAALSEPYPWKSLLEPFARVCTERAVSCRTRSSSTRATRALQPCKTPTKRSDDGREHRRCIAARTRLHARRGASLGLPRRPCRGR